MGRGVRHQRRGVDRIVAGVDARDRQAGDVAVLADPALGQLALGRLRADPLAVGEDHRAEGRGDEQRGRDLEGPDVLAELIFGGVCARFPELKMISVESLVEMCSPVPRSRIAQR